MSELAVITPTWRPDAELFVELHRSVLRHTPEDTVHHVIVPWAHRAAFARYAGSRCQIWHHPELLPRRYIRMPRNVWGGVWLNGSRPWPPIRGWVMQQAAKIAVTAMLDADIVLIADSDVILVRPVDSESFTIDGRRSLYRMEGAVHAGLQRHVRWHRVARELLGFLPRPASHFPTT